MKKTLIALAAVAASSVALAQNVTISGGVGLAFERNNAAAQLVNADANGTNLTFTGTEDLGGGMSAGFKLNPRIDGATGANVNSNAPARLVQNAHLYIAGGFGRISFGREGMASAAGYDAFGAYGEAGNYGWSGQVGFRADRTIWYTSPTFGGFSFIGGMTANNANDGTNEGTYFRASYAAGPLSLSIGQEKNPGGDTSLGSAVGRTDKDLAASYNFGVAKVMAVWGKAGTAASTSTIGATVPMGAITLKAAYKNATDNTFAMGADYALSKRTRAFADLGKTSGAKANYRVGVQHSF